MTAAPASQRAQALLEGGEAAAELERLWPHDAPRRRALAWELKDECLAAWTADPPHTRRCADLLARLHGQLPDDEVAALAAWAAGIAALAEGGVAAALPLLEQAHDALAAAQRRHAAAETLVPRVMALAMLGRHAEALACGERARAVFVQHGDGHAAGRVELNLATLLFRIDRHAEAARMYRRAAVHFARARDDARSILADIGLAHALSWLFDFDEALHINQRALRRASQRSLLVPQAQARLAIGRIELLRGRFHRALPELVRALALMDEAGAAPQQRLEAAMALADAYLAVNLLPEAHALYDQAIAAARSLDAPVEEARARVERARVLARLGQRQPALVDLERALALFDLAGNAVAGADVLIAAGGMRLA
ncbi:MAG: tetratricopeptide repeat protein, partial [Rubrivivax sp.]|nr:tetratricopeptide repeat protein [Rubrivivax sp.]